MKGTRLLSLLLLLSAACAEPPDVADLVLHNVRIYTGDENNPWAAAVAVRDKHIIKVGNDDSILALAGKNTRVIDLGQRMAMPGINDAHNHAVRGAASELFECRFPFTATPEEISGRIEACVNANPPGEWITGGQWTSDFFVNNDLGSPRRWLDRISGSYAIVLKDDSYHNLWANSKALQLAGITAGTPDPEGGRIRREGNSMEPDGVLEETAVKFLLEQVPPASPEQFDQAAMELQQLLPAHGITGFKIARAPDAVAEALHRLDRANGLNMHVSLSLHTPKGPRNEPLDIELLKEKRRKFSSGQITAESVKIFLDGVPTASRTAKMLAPYTPAPETGDNYTGELLLTPALLADDVTALDKAGFRIKIHTAGDGSVRTALDAIARARHANGFSGPVHELAHAGFVDAADIPRFKALRVAPELSPFIWFPSQIIDSVINAVGERGAYYWPTRDLLDAGAHVMTGSDWPAAVKSVNPWRGIEALVTRRHPDNNDEDRLWPEQSVSLAEALQIFTSNNAEALGLSGRTGQIKEGMLADIIVLDRNLFEVPADQIGETRVLLTIFDGRIVYESR
jgi:predicted amidohydrolase YtcJ